jgi:hypothetical protein
MSKSKGKVRNWTHEQRNVSFTTFPTRPIHHLTVEFLTNLDYLNQVNFLEIDVKNCVSIIHLSYHQLV